MSYERTEKLKFEDAHILFRNFSGAPSAYNDPGDRNFCVIIPDAKIAQDLANAGWNVKILKPKDPNDEVRHYMQVKVSFKNRPPKVVLVTSRNQVALTEETIDQLDYAEIVNVDMTISPYHWEARGDRGIKGYLHTMYVTIEEDVFADKYAMAD